MIGRTVLVRSPAEKVIQGFLAIAHQVDGLEVLRQVKNDARLKAIPVVILTSSREERDLVESYKLGVNSYIQKPVDFDQFREMIKEVGLYWLVVNQPPPQEAFRPS